jgi:hypothetical protein
VIDDSISSEVDDIDIIPNEEMLLVRAIIYSYYIQYGFILTQLPHFFCLSLHV